MNYDRAEKKKHRIISGMFRVHTGYGLSYSNDRLDKYLRYKSFKHIESMRDLKEELNEVIDRRNKGWERTLRKLGKARNQRKKTREVRRKRSKKNEKRFSVRESAQEQRLEELKKLSLKHNDERDN